MTFCKRPFRKLFSGLWIGKNSTDQRNRFQMIYFDFSNRVSLERLEKCFETYCNVVLYLFIKDYASFIMIILKKSAVSGSRNHVT